MTNYEKIKNMSIEEMAEFFRNIYDTSCSERGFDCGALNGDCFKCFKQYLESEATND